MTHLVEWLPDGTPRSTLFDDVYRSRGFHGMDRGLLQARHVFLQGCGLWSPDGASLDWQGRRQWHVLETGFGLGLSFLATWHAWQQDPQRPERLFFTSIEAWPVSAQDITRSVAAWPELQPLADALALVWRGLLPGVHRLALEGGRVQLTLCVGPVDKMLREIDVAADSVFLDGFSPEVNPDMWSLHTLKAVARLCRTGTRVASWCVQRGVREDLTQCGFAVTRADGLPPKSHRLTAVFNPAWTPRTKLRTPLWEAAPAAEPLSQENHARAGTRSYNKPTALVLGAGLSGSAVACSLARRGWAVTVLDAGSGVGAGASGLPAGLTAPHVSPDDSVLSRITRAGVRATLQRCSELLQPGIDWAWTGVLEHRVEGKRALPSGEAWPPQGHEWSTPATAEQISRAGLPAQAQALWHAMGGWLRPRQLVAAQLVTPGIEVRWNCRVNRLRLSQTGWQVLDAQGRVMAQADQLIVAGGFDTGALLAQLEAPSASPQACPATGSEQPDLPSLNRTPSCRSGFHLPLNPLRGQNNVQGGGDMGALPNKLPGFQDVEDDVARAKFDAVWGTPVPPRNGWNLTQMFEAMGRGDLRTLYVIGENPAQSEADGAHAEHLLGSLDFLVVQDIFLTKTARLADVVLPGSASWCEGEGTVTNSERRVQRVRKAVNPPGEARDDVAIICELSRRLGYDLRFADSKAAWDEMRQLSPMHHGMSWERLEELGGIQWPCPDESHPGTPFLHARLWERPVQGMRAPFSVTHHTPPFEKLCKDYPLRLTTGRRLDDYNTGVQSGGFASPLRRGESVDLSPADARALSIREGEKVRIVSRRGAVIAPARIDPGLNPGLVFMTFHFPDEVETNLLTIDVTDPRSGTAEFKAAAVRVEKL